MSVIWPSDPATIVLDAPRLHALVIGVADYPHLSGGNGAPAADPLGLSQVTTPAFTARAIADWLGTEYNNPAVPLGSVDLLLSSATGGGPPERATMANIEKTVAAWVTRASADSGNIAFFYFCGHGVSKADLYLLPEDYGDPAYASPWRNCINFDELRVGLGASCKAARQVLFVDACRETPFSVLTHVNVQGQALVGGQIYGSSVQTQAVYFATTEGKQAYGPTDDVTFFGQTVLRCLDGLGTTNDQGHWVVDTHSLGLALGKLMDFVGEQSGHDLQCGSMVEGKSAVLHRPPHPKVLASIGCSSPAATAAAEIVLERGVERYYAGVGDAKPLVCEVPPGDWQVTLQFPDGRYPCVGPLSLTMWPPLVKGIQHP